eukprot:CAMPEP_0119057334 /NCGR_PEP_ID=MMETSP1178-20130426/1812_1 /TAXON_ID=33656 /ORGANISM="unid sp, Strain CCMP2000" /LENGTH=195 /DNA_ID=CAMNT_0007038151 /DNA_START=53 /DNA_END=640 /DNA_ORIENTATION=-
MATPTGPSALERAKQFLKEVQNGDSKPARLVLKLLSIFTGVFLLIAGIIGTTALISNFDYFIASLYTIVFGLAVLVIELNDRLRVPIMKRAYAWLDMYLKFLTLQRGKGLFYCGVGILVFFIGTGGGGWGLNNVAAMFLFIDGGIHTLKLVNETGPAQVDGMPEAFPPVDPGGVGDWEDMRVQAADLDRARGAGR